uniref:C-type lectin domain-containing protein n=1 Tax=Acrobeloides nanus TaxID=290746 RepID=A0A914CKX6_9BILA
MYVGGVPWDEGEFDICQKEYQAHHVSIHSAFEDSFLYNITNPQDDERVWLGYHSDAGVFGWSDNSAKDYFNFQNNQQPQPNGQEQCVVKNMQYGYWVVDQCSDFTSTVICKKPAYSF